jgi:hypothetical protein
MRATAPLRSSADDEPVRGRRAGPGGVPAFVPRRDEARLTRKFNRFSRHEP